MSSLDTLFDLSVLRTVLARELDQPLSLHGLSLSDLALLRELRSTDDGKLRRSEPHNASASRRPVSRVRSRRSSGWASSRASRTSAMRGWRSSC